MLPVRADGPPSEAALEFIADARHVFVDWDGCLVERGMLRSGAHRLLRLLSGRVSIVSNNSTDTPERLSQMLKARDLDIAPDQFFLAGDVTLRLAADRFGRTPVYLLANLAMEAQARALGLRLGGRAARDVVLLRDTRFTFQKLERAVNLLRAGGRLMVANPDLTHRRNGDIALETGALLAAIGSCVDLSRVEISIVGKPGPALFEAALAACRSRESDVVMIGDGPSTDIAGAKSMGIASVLIEHGGPTLNDLARVLVARSLGRGPLRGSSARSRTHTPPLP